MNKVNIFRIPLFLLLFTFFACSSDPSGGLPKVREIDLAEIDPALFSEEEWYMPYYLRHFADVANSVVDTGDNRGYFALSVWRGSHNHHPYNARIMEGILSLVWFYCTDRPWNIYYIDQDLKKRIEASLGFWCSIQNEDGRFSEYEPGGWSLAPTAFATKFIGRALWLLNEGPGIDPDIYKQSREALRKAIYIGFTHEGLWEHGRNYTNQYANLWGGALSYLAAGPDKEIEQLLRKRFSESMTEFQGKAGFFYEKGGPDWGYNLNTHHSDLQVAWEYAGDSLRKMIIEKTERWYDWFSYNAVKEPGDECYYLNRAIETRQQKGTFRSDELLDPALQRWAPQAAFIPVAHAFEMSDTQVRATRKQFYQNMLAAYPEVAEMEVGEFNAFTPYAFLHYGMEQWHPTDEQKQQSVDNLPYLKESEFIHLRFDRRSGTKYLYVRTPGYYATFNHGKIVTSQQRFGLGLIWNDHLGTLFQSQSRTDEAAWGTMSSAESSVYEASDLQAELKYQGKNFRQDEEIQNLEGGTMEVSYKLGERGNKKLVFGADRISVHIRCSGEFTEVLPLLVSGQEELSISDQIIRIKNSQGEMKISVNHADAIFAEDFLTDLEGKRCRVITLEAGGALDYEIAFQ